MSGSGNKKGSAVELTASEKQVDYVMAFLFDHAAEIARAHENLGVPLDVLFESSARHALRRKAVDLHQPELALFTKKGSAQ